MSLSIDVFVGRYFISFPFWVFYFFSCLKTECLT